MTVNNAKIIIGDSRKMVEVEDKAIDLVVTSPPYWNIKDYGVNGQIGYGQSLHEYLKDLYGVWKECYRVLKPGRRFCLNIGDQFARSVIYGRYKVIPLHAEFIAQCEKIGFDYMGSIIWQKKTTMNTTGGATVMGSYPYPPNGIVEIDYEYILVFKKPGKPGNRERIDKRIKDKSRLTKEEWKEFFYGHWNFGGVRQIGHEAMFPEELPNRLIKMFTFIGDTVLDPFLGSGTTIRAAMGLNRNSIGYEINVDFIDVIKEKIGLTESLLQFSNKIEIIKREIDVEIERVDYEPRIKDAEPKIDPNVLNFNKERLYKIVEIIDSNTLKLNTGLIVKFLGIVIEDDESAMKYLERYVLNKKVFLKYDSIKVIDQNIVEAHVYLNNRIFINSYLIKSGIATADRESDYLYKDKFIKLEAELGQRRNYGEGMDTEQRYEPIPVEL